MRQGYPDERVYYYHERYIDCFLTACAETTRRCHALLFVNAMFMGEDGWRNTTFAFNQGGCG